MPGVRKPPRSESPRTHDPEAANAAADARATPRANANGWRDADLDPDADAALRRRWRTLVDERLPAAARGHRHWPVRLNHCFARILLDDACGRPWRECVRPPAWRNTPAALLGHAVATGEAVLAGEADLVALNRASLRLRDKA